MMTDAEYMNMMAVLRHIEAIMEGMEKYLVKLTYNVDYVEK